MKIVQLTISDIDESDLLETPRGDAGGVPAPPVPHSVPANGSLRIEAVVSDILSGALVKAVLTKLDESSIAINATELVCAELQKAGPEATDLYYAVVELVERELIKKVLDESKGVQTKAATRLGINRNTLHKKMQLLGISDLSALQEPSDVPQVSGTC